MWESVAASSNSQGQGAVKSWTQWSSVYKLPRDGSKEITSDEKSQTQEQPLLPTMAKSHVCYPPTSKPYFVHRPILFRFLMGGWEIIPALSGGILETTPKCGCPEPDGHHYIAITKS